MIYFAVGSYPGGYTITKGVSLIGGWDGVGTGAVNVDPNLFNTIFDGNNERQLLKIDEDTSAPVKLNGITFERGYDWIFGGGVMIKNGQVSIENCVFTDNHSESGGGALFSESPDSLIIVNNIFESNIAVNSGGAIFVDPANYPDVRIIGNTFIDNKASYGAAISSLRTGIIIQKNQIFNSEGYSAISIDYNNLALDRIIEVSNNIIAHVRNLETPERALWISASNGVTHHIINNTFVEAGYGIDAQTATTLYITNNIFANCTSSINSSGNLSGTNNLFSMNGANHNKLSNPIEVQDVLFVDPDMNNYHIEPESPAVDAGAVVSLNDDIDGEKRPRGLAFDIGADEVESGFYVYLPLIIR